MHTSNMNTCQSNPISLTGKLTVNLRYTARTILAKPGILDYCVLRGFSRMSENIEWRDLALNTYHLDHTRVLHRTYWFLRDKT